jgi:hypothetical protein
MSLYRVYKKDDERGTNWAVMANDTDTAKSFVCRTVGISDPKDLRIGFFDDFTKGYVTVREEVPTHWGWKSRESNSLAVVEKRWKLTGKTGILTEFKP